MKGAVAVETMTPKIKIRRMIRKEPVERMGNHRQKRRMGDAIINDMFL